MPSNVTVEVSDDGQYYLVRLDFKPQHVCKDGEEMHQLIERLLPLSNGPRCSRCGAVAVGQIDDGHGRGGKLSRCEHCLALGNLEYENA